MKNEQRIRVGDMVTIYPRGRKKIWTADFWQHGVHRRRSLKTRNYRIAHNSAIQLEAKLADGTFANQPKTKKGVQMESAIDDFIAFQRIEGRRPRSLVKYKGILNTFLAFGNAQGIRDLQRVDLPLFDRFRAFRTPTLSPTSMNNEAVLLKSFLGWCAERQLIAVSPLASIRCRRPKHEPRGGPTLDQVNQILAIASTELKPVISLLAFTGRRAGDCQRLRVEDVDFTGNWVQVVSRKGWETKSGNSRKIPMHPRLRKILEQQPKKNHGWYFTSAPGRKYPDGNHHYNMKHANEDFEQLLEQLKIPCGKKTGGFTLHSLRSFFKTFAINAGIPREVVDYWQDHAGHRSTASDGYYKLSDEDSQKFMNMIPFGDGEPAADAGEK